GDAEMLARVQVRTWRAGYAGLLPRAALEEVTGPSAEQQWAMKWREAIVVPPTDRHHVLVALERDEGVGFAALEPSTDPDREPETEAELLTLLVDPAAGRRGHGSRLLAASVDCLRGDGCTAATTWVFEEDTALRSFL